MTYEIIASGFGGQGILFTCKMLAEIGLLDGKEVSWLPSYGPAMRGGTCSCSVRVSEKLIDSPLVTSPNLLIVMNLPSYEKFVPAVKAGGKVFADSSLINSGVKPADGVDCFMLPATKLALDNDLKSMANIIMLGKVFKETGFASMETVEKALKEITAKKPHLFDLNMKALDLGINYSA
ncbi:MAG: 2-oxoacid:acceptor oxidoreductase family protein [Oscillospiraceae bacterium]|nr:2-oxoacid:acceptor oxidoreductase family protein [Oscillospiraceae bacterium]